MKNNQIIIFTDGASRGNPGEGGWGAIIVQKGKVKEIGGRERNATNNQMELKASIEALRVVENIGPIEIFSDSSYVINGITKWVSGWRINDWKTKTKKEVLNRELWEELAELAENRNIVWKYLGGHSGIAGNERCDEIATSLADGKKVDLYNGPLSKYKIGILNFDFDEKKVKEKATSRLRSRQAAYSYVSMVDGKIKIHKTWADCEKRVKGKSGAKFKKAINTDEERYIIESWKK